ncbi:TetR/AcrR family transcriptional regulator [Nocardia sp. NPDC059246]|uniref:TetR/AcrR family transcriptional regulator n=1 Tax=unclassified Nocardia TaxID=2637762 RepID=UPI0036BA0B35
MQHPDLRARTGPTDSGRARTLAAAHELFATNGYRATTTKEICLRAGVAETTLFRNFGSKAGLFETTILESFNRFVDGWIASWRQFSADNTVQDMAQRLVEGLFKLVRTDRLLFQELIEARADPGNDLHASAVAVSTRIREGLRAVHDVGLEIAEDRHLPHLDPSATIMSVAAMIIGSVILEDWIVPLGVRTPGQARLMQEMAMLITHGISDRPD